MNIADANERAVILRNLQKYAKIIVRKNNILIEVLSTPGAIDFFAEINPKVLLLVKEDCLLTKEGREEHEGTELQI